MGCHLEIWRQSIGLFRMPPSKASRRSSKLSKYKFSSTSDPSWSFGHTSFCAIFIAVTVGIVALHVLPQCRDMLSRCKDVEANPGPVPHLSEELLGKLAENNLTFGPLDHALCNKHIFQLVQLKNETNKTWSDFVIWLHCLMPNFPEGDDWPKRLGNQIKYFLRTRQGLLKNKSRNPDKLIAWEESVYSLPSQTGSRPPTEKKHTIFDYEVKKAESEQWQHEAEQLKEENQLLKETAAELQTRPSPHKQYLQQRKKKYHMAQNKEAKLKRKSLEKELEKLSEKKKKIELNFNSAQKDSQKMAENLNSSIKEAENVIETLQKALNDMEGKCEQQAERIKELLDYNSKLKEHQSETVRMMDDGNIYKSNVRKCAYSLLDFNISFENVGNVIKTVLEMIGKHPDNVPSASTVANMNRERLLIAQKQLEQLSKREDLTIGTDETPKAGDIYMALYCS